MPSITVFSIPKKFLDHTGIIQTNAIRSWLRLGDSVEILLFVDELDKGLERFSEKVRIESVQYRSPLGTPLLDAVFQRAKELATGELAVYVNADIILMSDFVRALGIASNRFHDFLMVGQRSDIRIDEHLRFERDWEADLRVRSSIQARLHPPTGIDYFAFRTRCFPTLPPFAVGRPGWDNWMIRSALERKVAVVDATRGVLALHQNHDYSHVPRARGIGRDGPEADMNLELAGALVERFTISSARWLLDGERVTRALTYRHLSARVLALRSFHPRVERFFRGLGAARRTLKRTA